MQQAQLNDVTLLRAKVYFARLNFSGLRVSSSHRWNSSYSCVALTRLEIATAFSPIPSRIASSIKHRRLFSGMETGNRFDFRK